MIIVNSKGGLGNQMFQYALAKSLAMRGGHTKICLDHFTWAKTKGTAKLPIHGTKYLIEDVFDTEIEHASIDEIRSYAVIGMDVFSRFRRKLGFQKSTYIKEDERNPISLDNLLDMGCAFLDGYWQRFSLYKGVEDRIKAEFVFRKALTGMNADIAARIQTSNSVSIHVRRGDYLANSMYMQQGRDYYLRAVECIRDRITNPEFYVFSDDIDWCRQEFGNQAQYITWNRGVDSYIDMQLMSMCKHNIVTNSSFSVWGAWLNPNDSKLVIRPRHYYVDRELDEKYDWQTDWITI